MSAEDHLTDAAYGEEAMRDRIEALEAQVKQLTEERDALAADRDAWIAGTRYLRLRELAQAVVDAVWDEGRNPAFHREVLGRHRREWPYLWQRLDALAAELKEKP